MPDAKVEATLDDLSALIAALLDTCCVQVLETMFYASVVDPADLPEGEPAAPQDSHGRARIGARLAFTGKPSGAFEADADPEAARALAAGFLGIDDSEVTGEQASDVVAEFTNMTCGYVLSSLGRVEYFNLQAPQLTSSEEFAPSVEGVRRVFQLETGSLAVCLRADFDPA